LCAINKQLTGDQGTTCILSALVKSENGVQSTREDAPVYRENVLNHGELIIGFGHAEARQTRVRLLVIVGIS
jgi:hypothetical protein